VAEECVIAQDRAPENLLVATSDLNTTSSNEHAILNNQSVSIGDEVDSEATFLTRSHMQESRMSLIHV